jgi:hypothetical protein
MVDVDRASITRSVVHSPLQVTTYMDDLAAFEFLRLWYILWYLEVNGDIWWRALMPLITVVQTSVQDQTTLVRGVQKNHTVVQYSTL